MISKGKRDWLVLRYRPDGPFTDRKGRLCLKYEGNVYRDLVPVSSGPTDNLNCNHQSMDFELDFSSWIKGALNV